jgi:hypothetical protein
VTARYGNNPGRPGGGAKRLPRPAAVLCFRIALQRGAPPLAVWFLWKEDRLERRATGGGVVSRPVAILPSAPRPGSHQRPCRIRDDARRRTRRHSARPAHAPATVQDRETPTLAAVRFCSVALNSTPCQPVTGGGETCSRRSGG